MFLVFGTSFVGLYDLFQQLTHVNAVVKIMWDLKIERLKLVSEKKLSASGLCSSLPQWPPVQLNMTSTLTGFCGFPGSQMTLGRKRFRRVPTEAPRQRKTRAAPRAADCGCKGTPSTCPRWWRAHCRLCASSPN